MEFKKLFHLIIGYEVAAEGGIHALADGGSLFVGKTIDSRLPRLYPSLISISLLHDNRISRSRLPSFLSSFFTALEATISPWLA
jgi:hypothetical protein